MTRSTWTVNTYETMVLLFESMTVPPLIPLTGPGNLLVYGFYVVLFVALPAVGATLPVTLHRLDRRTGASIVALAVVISAGLLARTYGGIDVDTTFVLLGAIVLGAVVSEAALLVVVGYRSDGG